MRLWIIALLGLLAASGGIERAAAQPAHFLKQQRALQDAEAADADSGARLKDALAPIVREVLAEERAAAAAAPEPLEAPGDQAMSEPFAMLIDEVRSSFGAIAANAAAMARTGSELDRHLDLAFSLLTDLEGWPSAWVGLLNLAVMLTVGGAAGLTVHRLLARAVGPEPRPGPRLFPRAVRCLIEAACDLAALLVFVATAFLLSLAWFPENAPMRILLIGVLAACAVAGAGWALGRFLFAPGRPACRIPALDDAPSASLAALVWQVAAIAGVLGFSGGVIALLAIPREAFGLLLLLGGAAIAAATLAAALRITGRRAPLLIWIGAAVFLGLWLLAVLAGDQSRVLAVGVVFGMLGAILYLGRVRGRRLAVEPPPTLASPPIDPEDAPSGQGLSAPPVGAASPPVVMEQPFLLARLLQAVAALLGCLALLHVIGVDMRAALSSPAGDRILAVAGEVALILAVAAVGWTVVEASIARVMERERQLALAEAGDHAIDEDGLGGLVTSRFGTLLPLVRGFVLAILAAITIMVVLSSMGIDIGPLIAGAGVVGIAIGFGAQALVRDIISGIFFLVDDAFRVGEYVEFGEIRGQVEKLSVRSMRLRHHRGAIHTVPFGELRSVTNYNRDWAIYKQEFRLPYDTDTEVVRKIVKKVGLKLMEHPELGPKFIQPLKSQGVFKIEEGALILRTKFMCKPREQFVIRKSVFQEVKNALYAAGIELAQRRVQIEWDDYFARKDEAEADDGPPAVAVGAAALVAATGPKPAGGPPTDEP